MPEIKTMPTSTPAPTASPATATPTMTPIPVGEIAPPAQSTEIIKRHYEWKYDGTTWTLDLSIPEALYEHYRNKPRPTTTDYSVYVTDPYDDHYLETLAEKFEEIANTQKYDRYEEACFVLSFVQDLPYATDDITTPFDEYPRYPIETLVDMTGDCEDTSILAAALLDMIGYDIVLIELPNHMALGIAGGEEFYGTYYLDNGTEYFYAETTGAGWEIGVIPDEHKYTSAILHHLISKPILTHSWNATRTRTIFTDTITLVVRVENVGTALATNAKVVAGFDAGDGKWYNPEESSAFDLDINEYANATLTLNTPRNKYTRLVIYILYDGQVVDKSTSVWFQT
ncbi:MAG: hypothetical protein QMC78_00245 [Methanocellales archaeon]|nr:hypothetical protein [Methanocellales archaeon]